MSQDTQKDLYGPTPLSEVEMSLFLKDQCLLVAAYMYAEGQLNLNEAIRIYDKHSSGALRSRFEFNQKSYAQLLHIIAKKIALGEISPSNESLKDILSLFTLSKNNEIFIMKDYSYSEIEAMPKESNPLAFRRDNFNEEDIEALTKFPIYLACFDAYGHGIINLIEVRMRMFGTDRYSYPPRQLSSIGFFKLACEVVRRINSSEIILPSFLRQDYTHVYTPSELIEEQ